MKLRRIRRAQWDVLAICGRRGECPLLAQHGGEGEAPEAAEGIGEELAAGAGWLGVCHRT